MNRKNHNKKAFTVVELVIVIAVIAILAAVLIPTFVNLVNKANAANAQVEAKNLVTEMLANILSGEDDAVDLIVVSKKGNDAYVHGYDASEGKFVSFKDNPVELAGFSGDTFLDKAKAIRTKLVNDGAIKGVSVEENSWRDADKLNTDTKGAVVPLGFKSDEMAVFADCEIVSLEQTVTKVSSARDLTSTAKKSGYIVLESDIDLGSYSFNILINTDVTIDLNGKTVKSSNTVVNVDAGAKLTVNNGTINSTGKYAFNVKGGEVVVNGGNFTAQEAVCALWGGSKLTVNDGVFTAKDNNVIATNGSEKNGCEITINGGTFNANIETDGYIACGVYVANNDIVNINAGTFNITDGVGILMRAGKTTIGKDVVINLTNTGKVTEGKIGDANINISTPCYLVVDVRSQYPALDSDFNVTNNSSYELKEYK